MSTVPDHDNVVVPDPAKDYHGHPNYWKVFLSLMLLFGISLVVGYAFSPVLAVVLIFGTAIWKSSLVMKNFMHLKYEAFIIWLVVAVVLFCLIMFFFGVYPDITAVPRDVVPR